MLFVGLDVHVRNSYFYASGDDGERLRQGRCLNTAEDFGALWRNLQAATTEAQDGVYVVLESTTNSRALQRLVCDSGARVGLPIRADVLDARKLRVIAESVTKCDAVDARILNELARSNLHLPVCYLPDDEEFALREHLRGRHDLVRQRTMLKNRVSAVLHRRGILKPEGGLWTKAGRAFLAELPLDPAGRELVDRFTRVVDELEAVLAEARRSLLTVARRPRWAKPAALLQTIPGVGLITAFTLLAELGRPERFKSRAAVSNYAGLVPVQRDSNTKQFRGGITHRGSNHLRAVLCEAAWMAMPRVPVYQALYDRIRARRNPSVAIIAVARRLLEDAWTIWRRDEAFCFGPPVALSGQG